jgi:hypothetical protein
MKIKSEYVPNITRSDLFMVFRGGSLHRLETIGGVAFYNKKELISYTQGSESDWVSDITGPICYKQISRGHYDFCLQKIMKNLIPFYCLIYLINERSEWTLASMPFIEQE